MGIGNQPLLDPLFCYRRGRYEEVIVHGAVMVYHGSQLLFSTSESTCLVPARSLLKPFQFLALDLPEEKWVGNPKYAAAVGSVSASVPQCETLQKWHENSPRVSFLKLPPAIPIDMGHRGLIELNAQKPEKIFHTCFSKHLAILEACDLYGWPKESYNSQSHPFFESLLKVLQAKGGYKFSEWVVDGCTLPTPILSLSELALLYRSVMSANPKEKLGKISELMMTYPEWVAGKGRLDTEVMQKFAGVCVAKEGADGLWAIAIKEKDSDDVFSFVVKLSCGFYGTLARPVVAALMSKLGYAFAFEPPPGQSIEFLGEFGNFLKRKS